MSDCRRSYIPGNCWFFAVNLQNHRSDLPTWHIAYLRVTTAFVKSKEPFLIDTQMVSPKYMHYVQTLSEGDTDYSGRWRGVKKMLTRALT